MVGEGSSSWGVMDAGGAGEVAVVGGRVAASKVGEPSVADSIDAVGVMTIVEEGTPVAVGGGVPRSGVREGGENPAGDPLSDVTGARELLAVGDGVAVGRASESKGEGWIDGGAVRDDVDGDDL
jgi:hypothetical protein